jgi:uncharacterized protein
MRVLLRGGKGAIPCDTFKIVRDRAAVRHRPNMVGLKLSGKIDEATFRKILLALVFPPGAVLVRGLTMGTLAV